MQSGKAIFFASYPKSGNTWLRCWLEAYRRNGHLDINDIRICISDASGSVMQRVSPWTLAETNIAAQLLLRPAALMHTFTSIRAPFYCKTHFANVALPGMPACIPPGMTERAIYIVRDPRQVAVSMSMWMGVPVDKIVQAMNHDEYHIGVPPAHAFTLLTTWSRHVSSWVEEDQFPVLVLKYEDMVADPEAMLDQCTDFLGWKKKAKLIRKAVKATQISRLQRLEGEHGFEENGSGQRGNMKRFFHAGGTRWKDELGPKWIKQIEHDHGEVMRQLGYLDADT